MGIDFFSKLLDLLSIHQETGSFIFDYAVLNHNGGYILFGGFKGSSGLDGSVSTTVARLDENNTSWRKLGDIKNAREGHSAIYDGQVFLIIGGKGTETTEKCSISESSIDCMDQSPILKDYESHPSLFLVPGDFCSEL